MLIWLLILILSVNITNVYRVFTFKNIHTNNVVYFYLKNINVFTYHKQRDKAILMYINHTDGTKLIYRHINTD